MEVYLILYLFENSVRELIRLVLEKHGSDWWDKVVPVHVKQDVEKRLKQEADNRWHGTRGSHRICYTDIGDLYSIISANWQDFKGIFPDDAWIRVTIRGIELSRNIVAHNNPLSEREVKRLKMYYEDWIRQVKPLSLA
jgi:hypothetical protein